MNFPLEHSQHRKISMARNWFCARFKYVRALLKALGFQKLLCVSLSFLFILPLIFLHSSLLLYRLFAPCFPIISSTRLITRYIRTLNSVFRFKSLMPLLFSLSSSNRLERAMERSGRHTIAT